MINAARNCRGAESVVDVDDRHARRATVQHPEERGEAPKARTVPHAGWDRDDRHFDEPPDDARERSFHAGHDHEAVGALSTADGRGVGIARYVRDARDPQAAEIAVTIVDDWQERGLGTELLSRLSDLARQAGIYRFTALVSTDNAASAGLLRNLGASLVAQGPGIVEYELALEPDDYGLDRWIRCAMA